MLALWSKEVLEIWIVVYARLLPILMLQNTENTARATSDCVSLQAVVHNGPLRAGALLDGPDELN